VREVLKADLPASIVVTLVAIPLCLGIALASGAPMMSGLIAGIVGGLVVGSLSGSQLMVSGPAAGLTAVVLASVGKLGSFEAFLLAVVLAGVFQLALGFLKWGFVADYVPRSVVRGMLAAIGIILILKQLPHAVGYDADPEGDDSFDEVTGENTFSALLTTLKRFHPGAAIVAGVGLAVLIAFEKSKALSRQKVLPGPLAAVAVGMALNLLFAAVAPALKLEPEHLVALPTSGFSSELIRLPDFSAITRLELWKTAFTIGAVASIETLLSLDATDRLDPHKRHASPDRELVAQGFGNLLAGLLGGLPITGVIVRSSVNINAGAQTRASAIFHGGFLLLSVFLIPGVLNLIPLSALAAVLLVTGYKLAKPSTIAEAWRTGRDFFVPFAATIVAIVATDLLTGVIIGLVAGTFFILKEHAESDGMKDITVPGGVVKRYELDDQVTFLHRVGIVKILDELEDGARVEIDARRCRRIDPDVLAVFKEFQVNAADRRIDFRLVGLGGAT
jgi:carbonic anhydrase